jgi:SAM-dependent methyltransferase
LDGKRFVIPPYYQQRGDVNHKEFWSDLYAAHDHPWDLNGPHPALEPILPQIKIVKSRITNYGCGQGHDAAFLASKGHIVTGVDLSAEAIANAQKTYGHIPGLTYKQDDVFKNLQPCDVIFEHTLFCAISPDKRRDLISRWNQSLEANGYLLGIFFVMPKRFGPPYGGSEWELRSLLEKHFRLLYWKRWEQSPPRREGKELVVFAQKLTK